MPPTHSPAAIGRSSSTAPTTATRRGIGTLVAAIIARFAILFTGRHPRSLLDYIDGVIRWHSRVGAYAVLLITDCYPPFSLDA